MNGDERHIKGRSFVEFGRTWMTKNILTRAAREAVRIYAVTPQDNVVTESRTVNILSSARVDRARWAINIYSEDLVPGSGDNIVMRVDVTYNFPVFITGFIPGMASNSIPLSTFITM